MAIVSWQEKLKATGTLKPIAKGGSGGVYWEDYNLLAIHLDKLHNVRSS